MGTMTADDTKLIFEEPPAAAPRQYSSTIAENLRAVKEQPGRWARIVTYESRNSAKNLNNELRNGKKTYVPEGFWEFTVRKLPDGRYGVYARFGGGE